MEFNKSKQIIINALNHPYILIQKIHIYCPNWGQVLQKLINKIEQMINDPTGKYEALSDEEHAVISYGSMIIPAIILNEDEEEYWNLCSAIGLMLQNYANIYEEEKIGLAAMAINKIVHTKNSLSALLIQTESVILQLQSALNNSDTPYKLSKKFLTSLFSEEND